MKTPSFIKLSFLLFIGTSSNGWGKNFSESHSFDLTMRGAEINSSLELIAEKGGWPLKLTAPLTGNVTYKSANTSLMGALEDLSKIAHFTYTFSGGVLYVTPGDPSTAPKKTSSTNAGESVDRKPASAPPPEIIEVIPLRYARATEVSKEISQLYGNAVRVMPQESTNSIVIGNTGPFLAPIRDFISTIDKMPKQILIEAQIVESSSQFAQELGVSMGMLNSINSTSLASAASINPIVSVPTLSASYRAGWLDQQAISIKLNAAETKGDAKIISRPKIVTADRTSAFIQSGVTYHVKILGQTTAPLSESSGSSSTAQGTVTGGLQDVKAGLKLEVKPTIVDDNLIQLGIDLTNGEADNSTSVDGIPGVVDNTVRTTITVKEGLTATIAGLVKNQGNKNLSQTPILGELPILGWLFKSTIRSTKNNELIIFITPHILPSEGAVSNKIVPDLSPTLKASLSPTDL